MSTLKRLSWLTVVPALIAIAGPAAGQAPGIPERGGTLTIAQSSEPLTLDSRKNPATPGIIAMFQIQEGLLITDPQTGKPVPGLAESWTESPDGLTYTFKLRRGVRFHDGTEFDAEDVKYTFDFLTGERGGSIYVSLFKPLIKAVETPDRSTVIIRLTAPSDDFITHLHRNWATLILSRDAVERAGEAYGSQVAVGTGAFKLRAWNKGESVVLERNPTYWQRPLPYLDGVTFRVVRDAPVRLINARARVVDVVFDPALSQLRSVRNDRNLRIISAPGNPMVSIQLNTTARPFNDRRVRQAIYYGLDRGVFVRAQYGEYANVAADLFPLWHWFHDPAYRGVARNPDRARSLLAEAGYGPNTPLDFDLLTSTDSEMTDLVVLLQAQLRDLGVRINIRPMESAVRLAIMEGRRGSNRDEYKAALMLQTLPGSTTDDYIFKFYGSGGSLNRVYLNRPDGYQDPEIERLIDRARSTPGRDEQRRLYRQIVERVTESAVLIPIAFKQNVNVVSVRVQDFHPHNTDTRLLRGVWLRSSR